ncbi:protease [Halobacteriales archaeon QS_8_69_26]|nr:MAG: protease [Halobacteriales archaeon QS_8_69_26]
MTRDSDLARPIALTLALVLAIDLAFVLVVAYLLRPWFAPLAGALGGTTLPVWPLAAVPALVAFVWAQLRYTRRGTLAEVDAREVGPDEYPDLHGRVARLARGANVAVPAVAVAPTAVPNSFTVGGPTDAVVVVSEGLLDALDDDQLDAVLAHELAHVKNRDATVMTLASFLPSLVDDDYSLLADLLPGEWEGSGSLAFWGGVLGVLYVLGLGAFDAPAFGLQYTGAFVVLVVFSVLFGSAVLGLLAAPVLVLSRRLSRYREFAADRAGALLSGKPGALASALESLDGGGHPGADRRAVATTQSVRGLCLLPHGFDPDESAEAADDPVDAEDGFYVRTRSHPPTGDRIARLRELTAEMESGAVTA